MSRFSRWRTRREAGIELSEQNGVRALHLGSSLVQSAMRLSAPNDLELAYTRCMMGFLLFHPRPTHILMIGLGGGSLAKFVYHRLPQTWITAVEVDPQIVAAARNHFFLPADDERLRVVIADGAEYIVNHPASTDVLMIDAFDDGRLATSLCSPDFYGHARMALKRNGMLVINLLSSDRNLGTHLRRIGESFGGRVLSLLSEVRGNLIVFAFRCSPGKPAWTELRERAVRLEAEFALPFPEFAAKLRRQSPYGGDSLEI